MQFADLHAAKVLGKPFDNSEVVTQTVKLNQEGNQERLISGLSGTATQFVWTVPAETQISVGQMMIEATDNAGNVGVGLSGTFSVVLDTTHPSVSQVELNKTKVKRKKDPTLGISWNVTDDVGVASQDLVFASEGSSFTTTVISGLAGSTRNFTWTVPATILPTKTGVIKIIATDRSGNRGEAVSTSRLSIK